MEPNGILKLIVDKEYPSAAEQMIKSHRPNIFMSWDKLTKEKARERVARQLGINYIKFQYLRRRGYSPRDIAREACLQTKEDCLDIFPETNKSLHLHEQLNDDEEP